MAKLSPIGNNAQFIGGAPANGAKLFFYASGSSTKQTTYTDEAGLIPQTNPIILDSRGEPSQPIWLTEGLSYKVVFTSSTDTDPPVSPIWDVDNVTGINDTSLTIDQWVNSSVAPTYVSANSFTLLGDQTSAFGNKRRVKFLVAAGVAYGTIVSSVFSSLTTVSVIMDSTPLDSGLSSVQLGLLTYSNPSIPSIVESVRASVAATSTSTPLWASTAQIQDWTGTPTITAFPNAPMPGAWRRVYPATGTIITNNANIDVQGGANYTALDGDQLYIEALTVSTFKVLVTRKNGIPLVLSDKLQPYSAALTSNTLVNSLAATTLDFRPTSLNSGPYNTTNTGALTLTVPTTSSLGLTTLIQGRLVLLVAYNGGTPVLCIANLAGGLLLDETNLISPTTIGAASNSASVIYSASAVLANSPYRAVGFVDVIWTSGVGYTTLTEFQGAGGQSMVPVALNAQGSPPIYACRAWVNFNGTGVVAIRSSGNVSSITDNGTGDYTVNFAIAMPDINYAVNITASSNGTTQIRASYTREDFPQTTSAVRFSTNAINSGAFSSQDPVQQCVSIFR